MEKKIILVTGSSKGIGYEIVRQLSRMGNQVIMTARDEEKGKIAQEKLAAEGLAVHFFKLDVTNQEQIHAVANNIRTLFGHLDVLINNAGVMYPKDISILRTDEEVWNKTLNTNAIAPLRITQVFEPILQKGSRIIMMSSGGGSMSEPIGGWSPIYCISKSMLNATTRHLAFALRGKDISVNAICPGWVKTDMGGSDAPRTVAQGADTAVWLATAGQIPTGKFWRDRTEIPW